MPLVLLWIYAGVRTLMDVLGGIDFAVERSGDPGWLADVFYFLINPPPWFLLLAIFGGFVLVLWPRQTAGGHKPRMSAPIIGMVLFGAAFILCLGWWIFLLTTQTENAPSATPTISPETPAALSKGAWRGDRFIYDEPEHVFTVAVTPEDDERFYRITVPDATPEAFAGFKMEYEGGLAKAAIVPHQRQQVAWESISRDTRYAVRLRNDKTTVLKVHVPNNSDVTTIRIYVSWWGIRNADIEQPKKAEAGPRLLSETQKGIITESLKGSDWQPNSIWIRYATGCDECRRYALDFKAAFTLAGWSDKDGRFGRTWDEREDLNGLKLHVVNLEAKSHTAALLGIALDQASVPFEWSPWPEIPDEVTIVFVYRQND